MDQQLKFLVANQTPSPSPLLLFYSFCLCDDYAKKKKRMKKNEEGTKIAEKSTIKMSPFPPFGEERVNCRRDSR